MIPLARKLGQLPPHGAGSPSAPSLDYERGRAEAGQAAERQLALALETERQAAAAALAAERERWAAEEAEKLRQGLSDAIAGIERRLQEDMARILMPFLEGEIKAAALRRFADTVRTLLKDGKAVGLRVRGPRDLLQQAFGLDRPPPCSIETEPGEACEVSATCSQTRIETQTGLWLSHIGDQPA